MATHFDTRAVRAGQQNEATSGAVTTPIFQTSTFAQTAPGEHSGYNYARTTNPGRATLEANLASLENATHAVAYASGLSAAAAVLQTLKAGDHIIAPVDLYGGCYRLFTKVYANLGLEFTFVDTTKTENIRSAWRENTVLLWLETPSNPLLRCTDIAAGSAIARKQGARTLVDNTFATPWLQSPLEHGADMVLHSTTKYLNGHADVIGGALVTNSPELDEQFRFVQNAVGAVPGPQDCFLVLRGIKTLGLRMARHCDSAESIVDYLQQHPEIRRVYYPGLKGHPGYKVARSQMKRPGAMISFELRGGLENARQFCSRARLFTLAESLGAAQSLCNHPASMTHASMDPEARAEAGIADGLVRLSVGLEHVDDLIADLEQALEPDGGPQ